LTGFGEEVVGARLDALDALLRGSSEVQSTTGSSAVAGFSRILRHTS
jgi:hypothetical protein